jgi:hypothetical protein
MNLVESDHQPVIILVLQYSVPQCHIQAIPCDITSVVFQTLSLCCPASTFQFTPTPAVCGHHPTPQPMRVPCCCSQPQYPPVSLYHVPSTNQHLPLPLHVINTPPPSWPAALLPHPPPPPCSVPPPPDTPAHASALLLFLAAALKQAKQECEPRFKNSQGSVWALNPTLEGLKTLVDFYACPNPSKGLVQLYRMLKQVCTAVCTAFMYCCMYCCVYCGVCY